MTKIILICYYIIQCYIMISFSQQDATRLVQILNDTLDDDDLNLPQDLNNTSILRVGHRTHDCQDFKKAYVCIMKCLELGYHIAESNIKCTCTCFKDYVKGMYYAGVKPGWKVPTTSLPPWAVPIDDESDVEQLEGTFEVEIANETSTATTGEDGTATTDGTEGDSDHSEETEETEESGEDSDGHTKGDESKEETGDHESTEEDKEETEAEPEGEAEDEK